MLLVTAMLGTTDAYFFVLHSGLRSPAVLEGLGTRSNSLVFGLPHGREMPFQLCNLQQRSSLCTLYKVSRVRGMHKSPHSNAYFK